MSYTKQNKKIISYSYIPEEKTYTDLLSKDPEEVNFSLFSPRMTEWEYKKDENDKEALNVTKTYISEILLKQSNNSFSNLQESIKRKNDDLDDYIAEIKRSCNSDCFIFKCKVYTKTPLITGLGAGHPTERGMILDRNLGIPYIPASSVKGVCRLAYAINYATDNDLTEVDDSIFNNYFGTKDQDSKNYGKGHIIFFDALPDETPRLKLDIMNPHFKSYYSSTDKKYPTEDDTPTPIDFLAVDVGCVFTFRCIYIANNGEELNKIKNDVERFFNTAFEEVGFGSKTAIGYGRFTKNVDKKNDNKIKQEKQQKLNTRIKNDIVFFSVGDILDITLDEVNKKGKWRGHKEGSSYIITIKQKNLSDLMKGDIVSCMITGMNNENLTSSADFLEKK